MGPERSGSLVIELATGTAIVDGTRIEIPPGEFQLLTTLAARPGEVFSSQQLLDLVWPGDPVVANQDLRWRVWSLRNRIGDKAREHMIVGNRPRFGYLIDLPPNSVQVIEGAPDVADTVEPEVIYLDEVLETTGDDFTPVDLSAGPTSQQALPMHQLPVEVARRPRFRPRIVVMAAALAVILFSVSWVAGAWLSRRDRIDQSAPSQKGGGAPESDAAIRSPKKGQQKDKDSRKPNKPDTSPRRPDRTGVSLGAPGTETSTDGSSTATESATKPRPGAKTDEASTIPAQPEARLFHLYNPDSGDHYMTTSSSTANHKQAEGYELSTEGRVFLGQEKGTAAITLDDGTAFVYRDSDSAPRGVDVAVLYRLSKDGDFFYAASASRASDAQAAGWSRSTVGYVAV